MRQSFFKIITLGCLAFAFTAYPCHVPTDLRFQKHLTPTQRSLLAHGHGSVEQIAYKLDAATACTGGMADIFPCENVDLLAHLPLESIGGGTGNDLWGWKDSQTGKEYALVGRSNGVAFVDVTDPQNPIYVGNLPTHAQDSAWRDIKVYRDHAFVVADFAGDHGLQIFNLRQLRNVTNPPETFSAIAHHDGFTRAHNVVINEESGYAYAVGLDSGTCGGGLYMIDIRRPREPAFAGCFDADGYTHDAQCVIYQGPDAEHRGREICFASNEDSVTVVDVTDKAFPELLSRVSYDNVGYIHQGWLTEDHAFFVQDDEADERLFGHNTRTYVWDMRDLDNPTVRGEYTAPGSSIDHNQFVRGNYAYQANYRRGLRILSLEDVSRGRLSEVAFFDTYPEGDGNDFSGAWSAYPYFDNGIVLISDVNRGLFIVQPHLTGGDTCDLAPGDNDYCTVCGPCTAGQGDCDGSAQCQSGLRCASNVGADFGFRPNVDVCVDPSSGSGGGGGGGNGGAGCALPLGHGNYCVECGPCGVGEGDCDGSAQCQSGLRCASNVGADFGFSAVTDVCVDPSGGGGNGGGGSTCSLPAGHKDYCRDCGPCGAGEGDCDGSAQCQSGLRCAGNVGADFGFSAVTDVCVSR